MRLVAAAILVGTEADIEHLRVGMFEVAVAPSGAASDIRRTEVPLRQKFTTQIERHHNQSYQSCLTISNKSGYRL